MCEDESESSISRYPKKSGEEEGKKENEKVKIGSSEESKEEDEEAVEVSENMHYGIYDFTVTHVSFPYMPVQLPPPYIPSTPPVPQVPDVIETIEVDLLD